MIDTDGETPNYWEKNLY